MPTRANSGSKHSRATPRAAALADAPPVSPAATQPIADLHRIWYGTPAAAQPSPTISRAAAAAPRTSAVLADLHALWYGGGAAPQPAGSGPVRPQSVGPVAPAGAIADQIAQLHALWDKPGGGSLQPASAGPLQPMSAGPTAQPMASDDATEDLLDQLRGGNT